MTATLIEHAQYVDAAGKPIVGGKLYIGTNGVDPVVTAPTTKIFSDRALQVEITNPQILDSKGRSENKIWVAGKYSIQVNSVVGIVETQEFQDLDAGASAASESIIAVSGIVGGDTITGTTDAALSAYTAGQQFVFETASVNTGPVTLNIDGVGAKAVVFNVTEPLEAGAFSANQEVIVVYNATNDNFDWVNQKTDLVRDTTPQLGGPLDANSNIINQTKGADVASATELVLGDDGNSFDVTGAVTIATIESKENGTIVILRFDSTLTLTDSSSLELPGGVDITTATGDLAIFQQNTFANWRCVSYSRANGRSAISGVADVLAIGSVDGLTVPATPTFNDSTGMSTVTQVSTGLYQLTMSKAAANAQYIVQATALDELGTIRIFFYNEITNKTTTVFRIRCDDISGNAADCDFTFSVIGAP